MDIGLDRHFDAKLDHRKDLPTVEGRAEFEQVLRIHVTAYFYDVIGTLPIESAASFLKVQAQRVADDKEMIDRLSNIVIEPSEETPNTLDVSVVYATGDDLTFTLSE